MGWYQREETQQSFPPPQLAPPARWLRISCAWCARRVCASSGSSDSRRGGGVGDRVGGPQKNGGKKKPKNHHYHPFDIRLPDRVRCMCAYDEDGPSCRRRRSFAQTPITGASSTTAPRNPAWCWVYQARTRRFKFRLCIYHIFANFIHLVV